MKNFWTKLNKPILGLSPMDGITDLPFRLIVNEYSQPDISYTEFISIDGLVHGAPKVFDDMRYDKAERPIIVQFFGNDPELFYIAAQVACELGFDGIDINMGCPAKSVISRGAGAGLIKNPKLARKIIFESKRGVDNWVDNKINLDKKIREQIVRLKTIMCINTDSIKKRIPISVKTRIGYAKNEVEAWIPELLKESPTAIAIHGRTFKQMYTGKANWDAINAAGKIILNHNNQNKTNIKFLGNGDIKTVNDIVIALNKYQIDGLLIGRGLLGCPWLIEDYRQFINKKQIVNHSLKEIVDVAIKHTKLHSQLKNKCAFVQIRKHLAWYAKDFKGATKIRSKLVLANNLNEIENILNSILTK